MNEGIDFNLPSRCVEKVVGEKINQGRDGVTGISLLGDGRGDVKTVEDVVEKIAAL